MKRLILCFDGTWNKLDAKYPTNVVLTAESVLPLTQDGVAQVIFYDNGVGTTKLDYLPGALIQINAVTQTRGIMHLTYRI
jgi:uncharacterized protein (DUF2235 family)